MRYSFTTLACVALAATSLAAPVIDKRARDIKIITEYTTIITTQTIVETDPEPTGYVQAESFNTRKYHSNSFSSSVKAPAVPTSTAIQAPAVPTSTAVQPTTFVTSIPVVETPVTTIEAPVTTAEPVVTSTPEPVIITSTIEPETSIPVVTSTPEPETTVAATTTATSSAAASTLDSFAAAILEAHNTKRALHGAPALVYDATMASYAQAYSEKCIWDHSAGPYGENLAAGYDTPAAAIEAWYDEESLYDYSAGAFGENTGHFTQVVWKSATKVGCGLATCGTSSVPGQMLTCEYDTGNVQGYFIENVLPLTS